MKPFRSLMIALLLSLTSVSAHMQDAPLWPPEASDVFAPNIKVLGMTMLDKVQQSPLGKIAIIPVARVIKGADGRVYPWPASVPYFQFTAVTPIVVNNLLYLYQTRSEKDKGLEETWTLNLITGVFNIFDYSEMPDTLCGKLWPRFMGWMIYNDNDKPLLCNLSTGERSSFPAGYSIFFTYEPQPLSTGEHDNRLILVTNSNTPDPRKFTIFVRDPISKQVENIGELPFEAIRVETKPHNIILFTLYNADGKVMVYGIFNPGTNYITPYIPPTHDSSPLSEWSFWPNPNIANFEVSPVSICKWHVYDLVTNQEITFPLGDLCYADFTRSDGTGYYRRVSPDKKNATVVRYNPITKERHAIYTGEIEKVVWASVDDRYVGVVMDDSGQIDSIPEKLIRPHAAGKAIFKLIDLRHDITVFQTPAVSDGVLDVNWLPRVNPFAANWLAVGNFNFTSDTNDTVIEFLPEGIKTQQINIEYKINEEWATYSDRNSFGLYHLPDNRRIPIFKNPPQSKYLIESLVPLGASQFEVIVKYDYWPDEEPPDTKRARFIIKLPTVNLPTMLNALSMRFSTLESDGYKTDTSE